MKMRKVAVGLCILAAGSLIFSHGGGLDRCGGHTNRKTGGYHVHNQAAYCVCHPEATGCGGGAEKPKPAQSVASAVPAQAADTLAGLRTRIDQLETRVAALERTLAGN